MGDGLGGFEAGVSFGGIADRIIHPLISNSDKVGDSMASFHH